jgi:hypothetical protein
MSKIGRNPLRTHAVYRVTLRLQDNFSKEQRVAANLISANIAGYDLILGMAWLLLHISSIIWHKQMWYWQMNIALGKITRSAGEPGRVLH